MTYDGTQASLKLEVSYDPATGLFSRPNGRVITDQPASLYVRIMLSDGKTYVVHRLAWLYMTGSHPVGDIDHIDGNRKNNKFDNLRDCTHSENMMNRGGPQANNALGIIGVSKSQGRFQAQIQIQGKRYHLGRFDTAELASQVYQAAAKKMHAGFADRKLTKKKIE